jgi:hypothetical protein
LDKFEGFIIGFFVGMLVGYFAAIIWLLEGAGV